MVQRVGLLELNRKKVNIMTFIKLVYKIKKLHTINRDESNQYFYLLVVIISSKLLTKIGSFQTVCIRSSKMGFTQIGEKSSLFWLDLG